MLSIFFRNFLKEVFLLAILQSMLLSCAVHKTIESGNSLFYSRRAIIPNISSTQDSLCVSFYYRNATSHNAEITEVRTSCGCTKVRIPQRRICKNDTGHICVVIDIGKVQGMFHQEVLIYTDKFNPILLSVKGFKQSISE